MNKFAALLNEKWTSSMTLTSKINGQWAEDGNFYEIIAPPQLVNSIVAMQNYVFDLNAEVVDMENKIKELTKSVEEFKIARGYK
jgi:hypothetical protein